MEKTSVGQPGRVSRKTAKEMSGDPLVWTRGPGVTMNRRCAPAQTLKLTTQLSRLVAILIHVPTRAMREDQRRCGIWLARVNELKILTKVCKVAGG